MAASLRVTKLRRYLRLSVSQIQADVLAAVSVPRTIFTGLFGVFTFWIILAYMGVEKVIETAPMWFVHTASFLLAALCVFIILVITAPIRAWRSETQRGAWVGSQFVYHVPQHVLTTRWTPEDNGKGVKFTIPDVEPNSIVKFNVDVDGGGKRTVTDINFKHWELPIFVGGAGGGQKVRSLHRVVSAKVGSRCEATLYADSLPGTEPATIRVSIMSFDVSA